MNLLYVFNNAVVVVCLFSLRTLYLEELVHIYSLCFLKQLKATEQVCNTLLTCRIIYIFL